MVPLTKAGIEAASRALGDSDEVKRQLLELAKDSPSMQDAAEHYARRIAIKQKVLLKLYQPLAKWVGESRDYLGGEFIADMSAKIADVPEEHLTSPPPAVAVPAMQGLGYSLGEPELKEMYLNLLALASDDRHTQEASSDDRGEDAVHVRRGAMLVTDFGRRFYRANSGGDLPT